MRRKPPLPADCPREEDRSGWATGFCAPTRTPRGIDAPTDLSQTRPSSTICPRKARSSKPRSRYPGPLRPQSGSGQSSHRAILGRSLPAGRKPRASHSALRNVFQAAGNRTRKADAASRPKGSLLLRFQQQSGTFCIEHGGSAVKPPLTEASPFRCKGFRLANGLDGPRREAKESRRERSDSTIPHKRNGIPSTIKSGKTVRQTKILAEIDETPQTGIAAKGRRQNGRGILAATMQTLDMTYIHAPATYDFRERSIMYGPVSDMCRPRPSSRCTPWASPRSASTWSATGCARASTTWRR